MRSKWISKTRKRERQMIEVFVAGPAVAAKKNQWSLMTDSKAEALKAVAENPSWVMAQVPPANLKPRRRGKRRGN